MLIFCYFANDFRVVRLVTNKCHQPMCNKTNVIDFTTITVSYDNKDKFFCVKSRCLCCAIALQFPQRVVSFFVSVFSISKPQLFYWKLCRSGDRCLHAIHGHPHHIYSARLLHISWSSHMHTYHCQVMLRPSTSS